MYVFITFYILLLKVVVWIIGGKFKNSISSLLFLLLLYQNTDTFIDVVILLLAFVSGIHHSIRYKNKSFIQNIDTMLIVTLVSALLLTNHNNRIILTCIISILHYVSKSVWSSSLVKNIVFTVAYYQLICFNEQYWILILLNILSFSLKRFWDVHNIYRYSWHISSVILLLVSIQHFYT